MYFWPFLASEFSGPSAHFLSDPTCSRFSRSWQTAIQMIFWSSDLDSPRRVSMVLHLFKPFGNHIATFMTIYVSKPTSLTHIWVEHFSDSSKYNICLFGIRKLGWRAFFLQTPVANVATCSILHCFHLKTDSPTIQQSTGISGITIKVALWRWSMDLCTWFDA